MSETLRGVVKWFNDAKGFGFIEHKSGKDVFVHYSVIMSEGFKTLKDGETVEYEVSEGEKGLHAQRVFRINQPASDATGSGDGNDGDGDDADHEQH
jgi:CspA family cold shock protein